MLSVWRVRRAIASVAADRAAETRTAEARPRPSFLKRKRAGSGAAPPQAAVAPRHELQIVLVAGPLLVFRQLDLLLRRLPAFSFARGDLHGFGGVLQESELVPRVLLRAQPVARRARMPRDQAFPVHRQHLLDRALGLERIKVDHAAARHRANREKVDHEDDLFL